MPLEAEIDDIQTEYHPKTKWLSVTAHFCDYGREEKNPRDEPPPDDNLWHPFHMHLDFNVADFALHSALNQEQMNCLLSLCHDVPMERRNVLFTVMLT